MTGLYQVCNTQDVRGLLNDAVKGSRLPDSEQQPVRLGRWVDLLLWRESCQF